MNNMSIFAKKYFGFVISKNYIMKTHHQSRYVSLLIAAPIAKIKKLFSRGLTRFSCYMPIIIFCTKYNIPFRYFSPCQLFGITYWFFLAEQADVWYLCKTNLDEVRLRSPFAAKYLLRFKDDIKKHL
jgi:hypothetical protein